MLLAALVLAASLPQLLVAAAPPQPLVAAAPPQLLVAARSKKPAAPKASKAKPAPAKPDDFELLPEEAKPDPARQQELEKQLARRRTMLQWHQAGGFATLASLAATVVLGQLDYSDKYGGGGDTGRFHLWHRWGAFGSAAIFAGTASLAVFAPVPLPKPVQLDHSTMHKIAMSVASAGMAAQIVLGIVTAAKEGQVSQRDFALAHQIVGYGTFAAALTGFTVLTF